MTIADSIIEIVIEQYWEPVDEAFLKVYIFSPDQYKNRAAKSERSQHGMTVKFVPNIPISRDEAESENHLSQRGLLSVAAPTPSGSGKPLFAGWHPPQE